MSDSAGMTAAALIRAALPGPPYTLAICGVPGSGKSTLAAQMAAVLQVPCLSADLIRKELAGVSAADRVGLEFYQPGFSLLVYRELGRRAAALARVQGGVIADGTFRRLTDRYAFRRGYGSGVPVLFAECQAPLAVLLPRAQARDEAGGNVSDATAAVVAREYSRWQPLDEVPARQRVIVSTTGPAPCAARS